MPGRLRAAVTLTLTVFLVALMLYSLNTDYAKGLELAKAEAARDVTLSVAVVNQDAGADFSGEKIALGAAYVQQLEQRDDCDYHIVPRGVGEKGLQDGTYQLLVLVPQSFGSPVVPVG